MQNRRMIILTAALLISGAVLANIAFIGLGSVFNYPDILQEPTNEIFRQYSNNQETINAWFLLLALSAGLLMPIAISLDRLFPTHVGRITMWIGILAAVVQVVGLLRWPLVVPQLVASGNIRTFEISQKILGTIVGETLGYLFTGLWTILVMKNIGRKLAGAWFVWFGSLAAGFILLGIFIPLGLPWVDLANFIGYVLWSGWLIILAILLLRKFTSAPSLNP